MEKVWAFEEAYFQTRVLRKKQYEAVLRLPTIFGQAPTVWCEQQGSI